MKKRSQPKRQPPPSVSYTFTMRTTYPNVVGMFARIVSAIGRAGGDLGAVDIVAPAARTMTRDITVRARDTAHERRIVRAVEKLPRVRVLHVSDRVMLLHLGGKIAIRNKIPVTTRDALSMAYTPGVARVCEAIAEHPAKAWQLTIKGNSVAVVSDGSAVLGLGNIGPDAAMPVMEGKAMLFKEFANIDAYPICLRDQDPERVIETVAQIATGFGGINLEDFAAPRCFEIEAALQERLDIPVFHDDQHGTAVVVLAGLLNAARLARKQLDRLRVVIAGAGAAGTAIAKILLHAGVRDLIVCDRRGILHPARKDALPPHKQWLAEHTNPRRRAGALEDALKKAHVFIGVSGPNTVSRSALDHMVARPIVFALANPVPEISVEDAADRAYVMATGRSDYPNQINNVLAFPGIFRGALDVRARRITEGMKLAAARALAAAVADSELSAEYIIPSAFNRDVMTAVAQAVADAAIQEDVARRHKVPSPS
jgi:malate dehydrogenase (oxaloacetate-decarboxylating)